MIGATLALAFGATLLAVFRLSGSPVGVDGLVWIGVWLVAIGCGMQLGAIVDRVALAAIRALLVKAATWAVIVAATAWAVYLAPGGILFIGLLTVPPVVGILGVVAGGRDRPAALAFLAVALGESAVHIPAALERVG
jgi:hypothetical protein